MARKLTPNQAEYQKQVNRINRIIRKYEKNYDVEFELPTAPKRITKQAIQDLKRITPQVIRKQSYTKFFDPDTGEYRTAQDVFKTEKTLGTLWEADVILQRVREVIQEYSSPIFKGQPLIQQKYNEMLQKYGKKFTAAAFKYANENYDILDRKIMYSAVEARLYINNMAMFFDKYIGLTDEELDEFNSFGEYI